jgi:hypothetical protein
VAGGEVLRRLPDVGGSVSNYFVRLEGSENMFPKLCSRVLQSWISEYSTAGWLCCVLEYRISILDNFVVSYN